MFIHMHGSFELLAKRMADRTGHFMPVELLKSQFAALDELQADERHVVLDIAASPKQLVNRAAAWLANGEPSSAKLGASAAFRTAPSSGA
ncbi:MULTISPECIES: hypothetical protein [unclassified Glutamicibacter]|uniref:hypothetical protein n=1 Tax=unclassified Glutamicibacter TaxID=2627139 RepID=UPI0037F9FE08